MSLTNALRIATGGMQYAQTGLGTVSHNITNANTPGFSRQIQQGEAVSYNGFGAGVDLSVIQRITDRFLENRSLNAVSDLDFATTRRTQLDNVEGAFSNASAEGGLDDLVNKTFQAVSQLANSPADGSLRRNAMQQAVLLTDTIRNVNTDLDTIQTRMDEQITDELNTVNDLLARIYDLNKEIALQSANNVGGGNTNDLADARDNAVKDLSKLLGLNVTQTGDGSLRILTETGRKLLDEGSYVQLKRAPGAGSFADIVTQNVKVDGSLDANEIPLYTNNLTTGRLKALISVRDDTIPDLLAELDAFSTGLTTEFNKIHSRGSTIPPLATLTSGNTLSALATTATDIYGATSLAALAGSTFDVSIVSSNGTVISTTVGTSTPVTFPGAGPYTLADLAITINGNDVLGNVELNTTDTSPGVLGVTSISSDGTTAAGTYTIRRVSATSVALYNAANTAVVAGTSTLTIVQPATGTQTLNFGAGVVLTTNSTLDISGVANAAAAGTVTLGNTQGVTATATVDGSGDPYIQLQTQTAGQYIVLSNRSGDALGLLGMNNFFTGTSSNDIAVKANIQANPDLIAVGQMRADGGLSSLDGRNALALGQLADNRLSFSAAGGLSAQSTTAAGYVGQMISDLAIIIHDANSRESFTDSLNNQIEELKGSLSGVNINEELSQMLVFQNSFQSSARIIQVVNDLFDSLLSTIR